MPIPCENNKSCPEIEKTKLQMYQTFSKMMKADVQPLLNRVDEVCRQIAVQSEQLRVGTRKFVDMEVSNRELDKRIDQLVTWQAGHVAQQQEAKDASHRAGRRWGVMAIIGSVIVQFVGAIWRGKGGG